MRLFLAMLLVTFALTYAIGSFVDATLTRATDVGDRFADVR